MLLIGKWDIISSIKVEELDIPETTYNFEVQDYHTYYVVSERILVHNACCNVERARYWEEQGNIYKDNVTNLPSPSKTYIVNQDNVNLLLKGNAPIGIDGKSVHLHHVVGKHVDLYNYYEITNTAHYANYKALHPWLYKT